MPGQIRHRVVGVERFVQIVLPGVALQQPPDPAGDGVGQVRQLGQRGRAHPLEAQAFSSARV
ncbi:MAG: hypothetical protein Tsb0027_15770 [Wenzhouxiangellaceae bacterium]